MAELITVPNKSYRKGVRLEYRAIAQLKEQGFTYATRTAGSHGTTDIIAQKGVDPVLFIQVKCNIGEKLAKLALKALRASFHEYAPVDCEVWVYHDGCKEPYIYP